MQNDFDGADHFFIKYGYSDLCRGIDGLVALVNQEMELPPFSNSLFLFCGRRGDRIKVLHWEGNGFMLLYKRLESDSVQCLWRESGAKALTLQKYRWLMEALRLANHKRFGVSSEKSRENLMERLSFLFNEAEVFAAAAEREDVTTEVVAHGQNRKHEYTMDTIPEDLPVERIKHRLEGEDIVCPRCGETVAEIGAEVVKRLRIIPLRPTWSSMFIIATPAATAGKPISRRRWSRLPMRRASFPIVLPRQRPLPIL